MEYRNLTTLSLIDKCADKDPLAWAEFVKRFSALIRFSIKKSFAKYSSYRAAFGEEIKDIEQNIMVSLWDKNKLSEVKNRENISYWLAVTARNATINHLKTEGKEILITDESYFEKLPAERPETKRDESKVADMDKKIKQFYNTLSAKEKIVFNLYFKKALTLKDISKIMHIPLGSVSSIVTRMRQKVKKK